MMEEQKSPREASGVVIEKPITADIATVQDFSGSNIDESDGKSWYVVQVYSGFEHKVVASIIEEIERKGLEEQFSAVVVPTEEVIELNKRGAKTKVEKKLLPSYILVRMSLSDETWHLVKNMARVIDFLGAGKVPSPISNREARRMLRMTQGVDKSGQSLAPRLSVSFSVGEQVRVSDGPFMSFNGIVEDVDEERARLKVSVTIFGRSTPVDLDYTQVDKI